jgi:hypothetical protein
VPRMRSVGTSRRVLAGGRVKGSSPALAPFDRDHLAPSGWDPLVANIDRCALGPPHGALWSQCRPGGKPGPVAATCYQGRAGS